jgi:hypothetical protein
MLRIDLQDFLALSPLPVYGSKIAKWGTDKERMHAAKRPQFSAGDRVVVVSPSAPVRGSVGVVREVVTTETDRVLRYHVIMETGQAFTFFGFELAFAAHFGAAAS